ncbi:class I SAM-dependent methyltransferase [Clostridium chromiireducens]|uniref:Class I SAM-dependent methyltransferase n=1 Tax=Clostridium chromiireducens TaxID=225345 RepID=A0A1V4IXP0_9CLOT|nr:class I SAM-dependent methyltransferase [Clostridium chromiireducens]OPJ64716.1 demethylmenaquinone methyltransferase [Clostridium chromiireducens]RII35981.1 class I SAM-dependent methyltransferase [Clostridium chromiireducens]
MSSREYFDNISLSWNKMRSEYFKDEVRERILQKLDVDSKVVGDLGCGTGFISLGLALKNANIVFAVDQSLNMLKELKKESLNRNLKNVYPIRSTLEELVLFDESLDAITINMALHHVVNPAKSLKEMYRVLKNGGVVVISDVYKHNGTWAREEMYDEWLGFSEEEIIRWLSDSGFKNIKIEDTKLEAVGISSKGEYTKTGILLATAIK